MTETPPPRDDLAAAEHRKREAAWDPAERWKTLQETITWAECQGTVRRNTPETCLRLERAKLGR